MAIVGRSPAYTLALVDRCPSLPERTAGTSGKRRSDLPGRNSLLSSTRPSSHSCSHPPILICAWLVTFRDLWKQAPRLHSGSSSACLPSFLQVARFQDRYFLRDGYHRAFGFLSRGIWRVPAFVREFGRTEEMGRPLGRFP